jgi:hypothetical protein
MPKVRPKREFKVGPGGVVDYLVGKSGDRTFAVGPLVCRLSDGTAAKQWYFVVATADASKHFHCSMIVAPDGEDNRQAIIVESLRRGRIVVHTFEDELEMLRFCEGLWSDKKIVCMRQEVEAERSTASR